MPAKGPFSEADLADVSDNPEWTAADAAAAISFEEALPVLARSFRRGRGPQKASPKKLISLRLDQDVVDKFRASGPGWQAKINDALKKAKI